MTDEKSYREAAIALNSEKQNEDIMERIIVHLGEMGTYQRWLVVLMLPFGAAMSFNYCIQIFIAATPQEYWCKVPELQALDVELRRNLSIPFTDDPPGWDRCQMFAANYTEVLATLTRPANDTPLIPCRHGWEFLFNDIPYSTIINEREWVCDRAAYAPFAQSVYFMGSLVGVVIFGFLGDAYGRLPAFIGANIIGFIGNIATLFTVGEWDFVLIRFIAGLANDACYVMIYIIVLEFIGSRHRTWVTNFTMGLSCAGAQVLTPVLALWLKNWRTLLIVTSCPSLLALAMPWIVPESVRWLASSGNVKRALKILKRFEKINQAEIPEDIIDEFILTSNKKLESDESLKAVLRSPKLRNCLLVLVLVGIIVSVGIDSIIRLSENIGSNLFVTFAASSFAELPALALVAVTLDRFGRRPVIVTTLALTSIFAFLCTFIARGVFQAFLAVTLRFFVNMALSVLTQLSPEVLPTPVRSSGNSLIHLTMFMGTVVSPYVVYSGTVWGPLPLVIIGVTSIVGTLLSLLLPETTGRPMPQTLADGERLVAENMLCGRAEHDDEDLPPLKKEKSRKIPRFE
ncbi:organic cation transporter protein [Amyelois transitella]|uniref:organic cation transporter protein n=1 Tax=Amyelois transitella TaxID=680683 RepID=UPI00298FF666|nr:organic cation transporter protein [Amyelois transitella]